MRGSTTPARYVTAPIRAHAPASPILPSVARELVLIWTMSSSVIWRWIRNAIAESATITRSSYAEKYTLVGQPVVPVVIVRR